jgi:adenylate kinase
MVTSRCTFVVLLGAPGAGKGELGLAHVATGDLFREALTDETALGLQAKSYMEKGLLVPDDVTIGMVRERLAKADCERGALLDGFPRTAAQAKALDALLAEAGSGVTVVPYIKVGTDVLLGRLAGRWSCPKCGAVYHMLYRKPAKDQVCDACGGQLLQRADDTPETQRKRIDVYFRETAPLIEYYSGKGLLAEVDGEQDILAVHSDLLAAIRNAMAGAS